MRDKLLKPEFVGWDLDQFLKDLGIPISKSPDEYQMTSFRAGPILKDGQIKKHYCIYGFKTPEDCKVMANFLIDNDIAFGYGEKSTGAIYEYHLNIKV